MVQQRVFEGTGSELQEHLQQHPDERFRLILLSIDDGSANQSKGSGLRRGMFPQLRGLTEKDFKIAEWHGEDSEL